VLLRVRRLRGFLHVSSANRGVCKTGISARPFRLDLLIELRQPQAQVALSRQSSVLDASRRL
jgi:hypothetical protein